MRVECAGKQQAEKSGAQRDARGHFANYLRLAKPAEYRGNEPRETNSHRDLQKKKGAVEGRHSR